MDTWTPLRCPRPVRATADFVAPGTVGQRARDVRT